MYSLSHFSPFYRVASQPSFLRLLMNSFLSFFACLSIWHRGSFHSLSGGNWCVVFLCWALAPFCCCFAVVWEAKRKSGWGFAGRPGFFGFLVLFFLFRFVSLPHFFIVQIEPLRSIPFVVHCLYELQDRALERHRPNSGKKMPLHQPARSSGAGRNQRPIPSKPSFHTPVQVTYEGS